MHYLIVLVIGIFAGGYGGYRWGASVEKKAAAAISGAASSVAKKV